MKVNKVTEIATLLANNPTAKVEDVLKKFKISKTYAYNLMTKARKKIANSPAGQAKAEAEAFSQLVYMATSGKKHRMQGASERIAETHHTDMVNHPPHYTVGGVETIDFIEAKELGYNLGNAVKYITRADHKGDKHEDLCKARWYLNREIAKLAK
jgi:hypothetical protein